jgi:hypothetical protein
MEMSDRHKTKHRHAHTHTHTHTNSAYTCKWPGCVQGHGFHARCSHTASKAMRLLLLLLLLHSCCCSPKNRSATAASSRTTTTTKRAAAETASGCGAKLCDVCVGTLTEAAAARSRWSTRGAHKLRSEQRRAAGQWEQGSK